MARPLRIEYAGAVYHVTSRGDRREDIFHDDDDRRIFLSCFEQVAARMNWCCHAYCLMSNHYHFVIETPEPNLALGMRQLNGVFTQSFNRRHSRVGHVFQGRYNAILVEKDAYLKELARYVVLNPVRAKMVRRPEQWPWSSYRATAGKQTSPPWLDDKWLLAQFHTRESAARRAYMRFVLAGGKAPSIWNHLRQQIYLGGERFIVRIQKHANVDGDLSEVPRAQRWAPAKPLAYFETKFGDSAEAMAQAFLLGHYTLAQIARHFGVHYSTVSRAVRNHEKSVC